MDPSQSVMTADNKFSFKKKKRQKKYDLHVQKGVEEKEGKRIQPANYDLF